MSEKSPPGRFTVQFNAADPRQVEVIDILNQQGRHKASFLTDAIWQYVHGPSDIPQRQMPSPVISTQQIEEIVKRVIKEQQKKAVRQEAKGQDRPRPSAQTDQSTGQPESPDNIPPEMAAMIAADLASIRC